MNKQNFYSQKKAVIRNIERLKSDLLRIDLDINTKINPGNFFVVSRPGFNETIASVFYDNQCLSLVLKPSTEFRKNLLTFDDREIFYRGPFGNCWPKRNLRFEQIIIADTIGIISLVSQISGKKNALIYYGENPTSLLFRERFLNWKKNLKSFKTIVKHAPSSYKGPIGDLADLVKMIPRKPKASIVLISLCHENRETIIKLVKEKGFRDDQIYLNEFFKIKDHVIGNQLNTRESHNPGFDGPIFKLNELSCQ